MTSQYTPNTHKTPHVHAQNTCTHAWSGEIPKDFPYKVSASKKGDVQRESAMGEDMDRQSSFVVSEVCGSALKLAAQKLLAIRGGVR